MVNKVIRYRWIYKRQIRRKSHFELLMTCDERWLMLLRGFTHSVCEMDYSNFKLHIEKKEN